MQEKPNQYLMPVRFWLFLLLSTRNSGKDRVKSNSLVQEKTYELREREWKNLERKDFVFSEREKEKRTLCWKQGMLQSKRGVTDLRVECAPRERENIATPEDSCAWAPGRVHSTAWARMDLSRIEPMPWKLGRSFPCCLGLGLNSSLRRPQEKVFGILVTFSTWGPFRTWLVLNYHLMRIQSGMFG